jgi:hypothetical protein
MSRPLAALAAALLLAAAPGALCAADAAAAAAEAKKAHDQAVQTALTEFRKAFQGGDEERLAAMKQLDRVKDGRVIAVFGQLLTDPNARVQDEAAKLLAGYEKNPAAAQALAGALNAATPAQEEFKVACLKALGKIRDWGVATTVKKHFHEGDPPVNRAAIAVAGDLKCPDLVDELIDMIRETGARGRRGGGGGGRNRYRTEAEKALMDITGEKQQKTAEGWEDWWKLYGARVTEQLRKEDREARERALKQEAGGTP